MTVDTGRQRVKCTVALFPRRQQVIEMLSSGPAGGTEPYCVSARNGSWPVLTIIYGIQGGKPILQATVIEGCSEHLTSKIEIVIYVSLVNCTVPNSDLTHI
jgi:hypothetical protein